MDAQVGDTGKGVVGMDDCLDFISTGEQYRESAGTPEPVHLTGTHKTIRRLKSGQSSVNVSYSPPSPHT